MALFETIILRKFMWEINAQPTVFPREFYATWEGPPKDFSLDLFAYYKAKQAKLKERRIKVFFPDRKHGNSSWNKGLLSKFHLIIRTLKYSLKLKREIYKAYNFETKKQIFVYIYQVHDKNNKNIHNATGSAKISV